MIRDVEDRDIARITQIYNWYIVNGVETFETEPLTVEQMRSRVRAISATHPYIVAEEDGEVVAYAYAHPWKERAAYAGRRPYMLTMPACAADWVPRSCVCS